MSQRDTCTLCGGPMVATPTIGILDGYWYVCEDCDEDFQFGDTPQEARENWLEAKATK